MERDDSFLQNSHVFHCVLLANQTCRLETKMYNKGSYHLVKLQTSLILTTASQGSNHLPESSTISQFKPPTFVSQERSRRPLPTTSTTSRRQEQFHELSAFNSGTKSSVSSSEMTKSPCPCCRRASMFPSGPVLSTCRQTVTDI